MTIKTAKNPILAFITLVRMPNLLIILLAQFLVRIYVIGPKENWLSIIQDPSFLLLCFCTLLIAAAGYIINDYYDIKVDIINKPQFVVVGKVFTRRMALFAHFSFNFIAIGISAFLGLKIFITVFVAGFLMWLYSNQLKRLALWGNLTISFLTGISILYLTLLSDTNFNLVLIYAVFAFVISLIREVIKDMEDMKGDAQYGCKTLPIVWGVQKTKYFIFGVSSIFVGVMFFLFQEHYTQFMAMYFVFALFPFFVFMLVKLWKASSDKDYHTLSLLSKAVMVAGLASIFMI